MAVLISSTGRRRQALGFRRLAETRVPDEAANAASGLHIGG